MCTFFGKRIGSARETNGKHVFAQYTPTKIQGNKPFFSPNPKAATFKNSQQECPPQSTMILVFLLPSSSTLGKILKTKPVCCRKSAWFQGTLLWPTVFPTFVALLTPARATLLAIFRPPVNPTNWWGISGWQTRHFLNG